ncbi:putative transcriptional regulatory protein [Fusarium oxysporum f. sp. cubense]|uniref:Putative transcriptional regulatory protein n=1 Tax=Fusarium oxysporum f. sp. cubense TaxID=61366 RepID=A0A559L0K4_FUSOC|nr:putative transcriptional regulatory protein [Fusarium oxysporum f. sp. cubense]
MGHQLNANQQNRHSSSELPSSSTLLDRALVKRPPLVEGETSFKTQALHASQVEELKSPAAQQSPTFVQELANLKDALQDQETSGIGKGNVKAGQLEQTHVADVKIPPPTSVMQLLQLMADERYTNLVLFNFWGVQNLESFRHLCKSTYFNTEPLTLTEKTSFNGTVSLILREIGTEDRPNIEPGVLSRLQDLCEKNFWEGVETYQVMSIATEEHVHILFLAVVLVSSMGTLPLQWSLTTAAAGHCLTLGYHREKRLLQLPSPKAEIARRTFWHIYMADKNLSQRLARAPTIQDWDVDAKPYAISSDLGQAPWDLALTSLIEMSRIQGQIYEKLYSPLAQARGMEERLAETNKLDSDLRRWYSDWAQIDSSAAYGRDRFDMTFSPVDIMYHSLLTLIHWNVNSMESARDISEACYEAAHGMLRAHLTHYPQLTASGHKASAIYAIWVLHATSFTPYVAIFLHCVANLDFDDLKLLQDVLHTLENIGLDLQFSQKLFKLCKALCRIAEAFLKDQVPLTNIVADASNTAHSLPQGPLPDTWSWLGSQITDPNAVGDFDLDNPDETFFGHGF